MNISATFQALSQREKALLGLLGIAVLITACVYIFPLLFPKKTVSSQAVIPPSVPVKQAVLMEMPANHALPAANVKNPFQVPPQYKVRKETTSAAPAGTTPSGPVPKPVGAIPALSGIIASGSTKMAILELGGNSDTVGVGGTLGGYTVASITDTQVVLSGPDGPLVVNIGR